MRDIQYYKQELEKWERASVEFMEDWVHWHDRAVEAEAKLKETKPQIDRDKIIQLIDAHFPIDSELIQTNIIGERLLAQAIREAGNWRDLPDKVLARYAKLCEQEK